MSAEILTATSKYERKFTIVGPIYLPFYNKWGKNVYWRTDKFDLDPIHLDADSTSGSPVLLNGNLFIGFLNCVGGRFIFDGVATLTLELEPGQRVYINENCNPYEAWEEYNGYLLKERPEEKFWKRLEFCTWVEQTKQALLSDTGNYDVINEEFVYNYLERIQKMGLPKGKFTIDDGWQYLSHPDGKYTCGDWEIDRKKFPNFEKLIKDITDMGYTPGLWFNPFCATPDAKIVKDHPEILSDKFFVEERNSRYFNYIEDILRPYYHDIFKKYIDIGIRKFKIDIAYSKKSDMIAMLKIIYEEVKKIDKTCEVESHIPDIFACEYCDAVRLNDVSIDEEGTWRSVANGHYDVCRLSSAGRILNLDHIGSNAGLQSAKDFMEHWHLLRGYLLKNKSYPVVSCLPDIYAEKIWKQFSLEICEIYDEDGYRRNPID